LLKLVRRAYPGVLIDIVPVPVLAGIERRLWQAWSLARGTLGPLLVKVSFNERAELRRMLASATRSGPVAGPVRAAGGGRSRAVGTCREFQLVAESGRPRLVPPAWSSEAVAESTRSMFAVEPKTAELREFLDGLLAAK
jgi:hypothetical protein